MLRPSRWLTHMVNNKDRNASWEISQSASQGMIAYKGWMFSKVNIRDIANSSLNLVETKFYEVGLMLPCLL